MFPNGDGGCGYNAALDLILSVEGKDLRPERKTPVKSAIKATVAE